MDQSLTKRMSDRAVLLVLLCTVLGAAAQVFFKLGASSLGGKTLTQVLANPFVVLLNPALLVAYCLYGMNTALLTLALRKGQLSLLYPLISLTYVWVTLLSVTIFQEQLNVMKLLGLAIVVTGVAILGKNGNA